MQNLQCPMSFSASRTSSTSAPLSDAPRAASAVRLARAPLFFGFPEMTSTFMSALLSRSASGASSDSYCSVVRGCGYSDSSFGFLRRGIRTKTPMNCVSKK